MLYIFFIGLDKDNIWYLKDSYGNPTSTTWETWLRVEGYFETVAVGQGIVVATDKDGNVFTRVGKVAFLL